MGKSFWLHITLRFFLKTVIADGIGSVEGFLHISFFQQTFSLLIFYYPGYTRNLRNRRN